MPQMGESIAEGTIVRWIRRVGDPVGRDEPLFEISTDKVDAEIAAPVGGVLSEIRVREGETVPVNTVVATIREPGEGEEAAPASEGAAQPPIQAVPAPPPAPRAATGEPRRTSPLVRRLAREHHVDLAAIEGSGRGGRVTKRDILGHLAASETPAAPAPAIPAGVEIVPMDAVRRTIAERMVLSRRVSAHVHTVFEVDFSRVVALREAHKAEFARQGARLTYLSFIARAAATAIGAVPVVNSSVDGDRIVYRRDINLGIAVALDRGLIVPVVRGAQRLSLAELSRAIGDLADRARARQLSPEDVQGGTFTITNHGGSGALFGMPIINQPQVAILGVGAVVKRPVVVGDQIAIRPMAYLTLGFDHRLIDGATADRFMSALKQELEHCEI